MSVAGVNGIVLTKLDGTAKGGVAVAIAHDLKLPIRYVGVGEGDRRPGAVLRRTNTSTGCSKRSGDVTDARLHGPRAVSWPRAAAAAPARIRWSAPSSCRRRRRRRRAGFHRARRRAARRGARARHGRDARARRDAVLHARAVLPRRAHRAVRRADRRRRHRPRRRGHRGSESARQRPRASRTCARTASQVEVGLGAPQPRALNQPFFTLMREGRPFVILKAATSLDGCIAEAPGDAHGADLGGRPTATRTRCAPKSTPSASASGRSWPTIRC